MAVGASTEFGVVEHEARADMRRYAIGSVLPVLVGTVLAVPFLLYLKNPGGDVVENAIVIGLTVVVVGTLLVVVTLWKRAVFQVTATHVVKRRPLLPPIVVARRDIAEAVLAERYAVVGTAGPRLMLIDRTSAPLLTSPPLTDLEQLEALASAAPYVTRLAVLHPREASQRWPRMLPWSHRHQVAAGLMGVGFAVAAILIAIVLIVLLEP